MSQRPPYYMYRNQQPYRNTTNEGHLLPPVSSLGIPNQESQYSRVLNVGDALSYLDQVKAEFVDQPEIYNRFLEIMKDFKSQASKPRLINGFNAFLPPGYSLEPTNNPADPVRVSTPRDLPAYHPLHQQMVSEPSSIKSNAFYGSPAPQADMHSYASNSSVPTNPQVRPVAAPVPSLPAIKSQTPPAAYANPAQAPPANPTQRNARPPLEFNHAINYVNKIKNRFAGDTDTYKQFLEILQGYQKEQKPIREVYAQVQVLFRDAPDLLEEFKQFLPDASVPTFPTSQQQSAKAAAKKPKRMATAPPVQYAGPPPPSSLPPPKKKSRVKADKPGTMEELEFFDKCKRVIGNKTSYNEFLKVLNLFSQEIIEAKVLIERVEPFLGKAPELFDWLKRFVKYDEDDVIYNIPADRPDLDLRTCRKSGHSYRKLPKHIPRPVCSGRDELCKDIMNDDWISHPVYVSETGFVAHKKTIYEEAMYRCEEERYEFDLNIEANLHVIALLEPILKEIHRMTPEQRNNFRLAPGLGGTSVAIYTRVIKKIYDSERGAEVIDALYQNPAVAVPVVLKRLKQKDEEWKRSQEIDAKNYAKSLDHQGIHFKTTDRKALNLKSLTTEIEVLQREQREKKSNLANRYQFDFVFKKDPVFNDCRKILLAFVEGNMSISSSDEEKIIALVKDFVPQFFFANDIANEDEDAAMDGKEEQEEKQVNEERADTDPLISQQSVEGVPAPSEMEIDEPSQNDVTNILGVDGSVVATTEGGTAISAAAAATDGQKPIRKRTAYSFYGNTSLYAFFRLYQVAQVT